MLQDRLDSALVTVCAYLMRGFGGVHADLKSISERAGSELEEFIILLFCFPAFEISNLFFKCAYFAQQRRLRRVGRKCALLGGQDLSVQFDGLALKNSSIADTYHSLRNFSRCLDSTKGSRK